MALMYQKGRKLQWGTDGPETLLHMETLTGTPGRSKKTYERVFGEQPVGMQPEYNCELPRTKYGARLFFGATKSLMT